MCLCFAPVQGRNGVPFMHKLKRKTVATDALSRTSILQPTTGQSTVTAVIFVQKRRWWEKSTCSLEVDLCTCAHAHAHTHRCHAGGSGGRGCNSVRRDNNQAGWLRGGCCVEVGNRKWGNLMHHSETEEKRSKEVQST